MRSCEDDIGLFHLMTVHGGCSANQVPEGLALVFWYSGGFINCPGGFIVVSLRPLYDRSLCRQVRWSSVLCAVTCNSVAWLPIDHGRYHIAPYM